MQIRIVKCTFVALETKGTYLASFLAKTLSFLLIVTLLTTNAVQIFHSHKSLSHIEQSSFKAKIAKSESCKICDHFFHHKSQALAPDYSFLDLNIQISKAVKGGLHLLGDYSSLVHSFSNKGPPLLA